MSNQADLRIEIDAAKALIYWKARFADEVAARAAARGPVQPAGACYAVALPAGCTDGSTLPRGCDTGRRARQ
jgi:hypothetical protein